MPLDPTHSFFQTWLVCVALVATFSLLSTAAGIFFERALGGSRKIWKLDVPGGQLRSEMRGYVRFILLLSTLGASWLWLGAIHFGDESASRIAATFAVHWVIFEIYYYGMHRALHTRPLYRFHARHHESRVTTSWTGQSLSLVESLGWIAGLLIPPAAMSAFAPVSAYGLAIYVFANTFVNLAGHANVEANPFAQRSATWLTHPWVYHALHHARFKNHYSFASSFMDRLFGTEWSDWPALHARVVAGQPLESLSERGD